MPGNILLLQGPMGPFFKLFARDLEGRGHTVYKINFNAGDCLFSGGENSMIFDRPINEWPNYLKKKLREWNISSIYLFGDTRPLHRLACKIAEMQSIRVFVFEEGYLRPHYITLEEGGVNGRSAIPREADFFRNRNDAPEQEAAPVPNPFLATAGYSMAYYGAGWLGRNRFRHYQHHRPFNPFHEIATWSRSFLRKQIYRVKEGHILHTLTTEYSGKYYLVPLQVHNDSQIRVWSSTTSTAAFIKRVIKSFTRHALEDTRLVLKHHPLDRGYTDYTRLIHKLAARYDCADRIIYIHDLHLPTLLDHAIGTVLVNSTVGLSSLLHDTPVITLGYAIYDIPGLTFQGQLSEFWRSPGSIDAALHEKFRNYLLATSQINGSFYHKLPGIKNASGLSGNGLNPGKKHGRKDNFKEIPNLAEPVHATRAA